MPERSLANAKWSASNESIPQPTPKVNTKLSPSYKVDIFQLNAIKGKKIESPTSAQGGVAVRKLNSLISSGSHVLSIADLLDSVKDIPLANEVFSKEVAKKLGITRTTRTLSPDTRYSLSLDSTPEVTVEDVQAEVDRVKWGFEWTDAKLLDNLNAVRRYLIKKYPDNAISLEIDNDQKRVIVDGISRFVDFDALSQKSQHISSHHPCKNGITVLY